MVMRMTWAFVFVLGLLPRAMAAGHAFFETQIEPIDPYVQQQLRYTVRFYYGREVVQGYLVPPEIEGMAVEMVSDESPVTVVVDGKDYQMIERSYLLFPQYSGELVIPGMRFSGRKVFVEDTPSSVYVRPRPPGIAAPYWLPVTRLTMEEQWHGDNASHQVGDIIDRIVTVEAQGLSAAQLPPLADSELPGVEFRRTKVVLENRIEKAEMIGRRIEHHSLMFTQVGEYRLPSLSVEWWDIDEGAAKQAALSGRVFSIGSPSGHRLSLPGPAATIAEDVQEPVHDEEVVQGLAKRMMTVILFSLMVSMLLVWLGIKVYRPIGRWLSCCAARHELKLTCQRHQTHGAAVALRRWAACYYGERNAPSLGAVHQRFGLEENSAGSCEAIMTLEAFLYGRIPMSWDGKQCWQQLSSSIRCVPYISFKQNIQGLPPLNP